MPNSMHVHREDLKVASEVAAWGVCVCGGGGGGLYTVS